jgi:single stranded DNA-binding protein
MAKRMSRAIIEGTEYARTTFSLATNRVWTDRSGVKMQKTTWFRITCWRRVAETVSQYLTKGRQVMVIGEVEEASAWTDRENNLRATTEVTARQVKFLGGGRQSAAEAEAIVEAFTGRPWKRAGAWVWRWSDPAAGPAASRSRYRNPPTAAAAVPHQHQAGGLRQVAPAPRLWPFEKFL